MNTRQPIDQVIRREQFERDHPEVSFTFDSWNRIHRATIHGPNDSLHEVVESELRALLDRLETIVAGSP